MDYCSIINDLSHYHMPPHNDISDDVYTGMMCIQAFWHQVSAIMATSHSPVLIGQPEEVYY